MLEILFLGTGAGVPSKDRAMPSMAVRYGPSVFLFDCGEGTQMQFMRSKFSFMKIEAIFITHMHGDHVFGLPGLLQTMGASGRKNELSVIGPRGMSQGVKAMLDACPGEIPYRISFIEMEPGDSYVSGSISVSSFGTEHGLPSLGYVLTEKSASRRFDKSKLAHLKITKEEMIALREGETVRGITPDSVSLPPENDLSVAYAGDTLPCQSVIEAVRNADVLIHEATFADKETNLAHEHFHSTASQAASAAASAGCGNLIITHISNRYEDRSVLLEEARSVFPMTEAAEDMGMFVLTRNGLRKA